MRLRGSETGYRSCNYTSREVWAYYIILRWRREVLVDLGHPIGRNRDFDQSRACDLGHTPGQGAVCLNYWPWYSPILTESVILLTIMRPKALSTQLSVLNYIWVPHSIFCFADFFRMIVGEYEQRAVYKRYNVFGNGSNSVLKTFLAIYLVN